MSASLSDAVSQLRAYKFTFPLEWCGMSMSCIARQVWSLFQDHWSLMGQEV